MTRKPAAFRPEDIVDDMTPPSDAPVEAAPVLAAEPAAPSRLGLWGRLFWGGLSSLVLFAAGSFVADLVESAFSRSDALGLVVAAVALMTALALGVILGREWLALRRLEKFEDLQRDGAAAVLEGSHASAEAIARRLKAALAGNARARAGMVAYEAAVAGHIIDGRERLRILEREALEPLDRAARQLVAQAARRVSVVTALSPRALVDLAIVLYTAATLIRRIAELYGGRPGFLAQARLFRQVLAHLALTGGMAAGDEIVNQLVGHGIAAKLSAKLGEGVLNGLMTARLGLTALSLIRPLPFIGAPRPDLREVTGDLIGRAGG